jgi:hypothetical protein
MSLGSKGGCIFQVEVDPGRCIAKSHGNIPGSDIDGYFVNNNIIVTGTIFPAGIQSQI